MASPSGPIVHAAFNGAMVQLGSAKVLVVAVRDHILADAHERVLIRLALEHRFRRFVVLMAQDARGAPSYDGPRNLVRALEGRCVTDLPWQRLR